MWWIYLVGAAIMFILMFVLIADNSTDWVIGFVAGLWLLNSARTAYREDRSKSQQPTG